jgi:hypothetical protein
MAIRRLTLASFTILLLLVMAPDGRASSFQLVRVVDLNTPIPNGSGPFTRFDPPTLSGGNVAFAGYGLAGQQGIYLFQGGVLSRVADLNTAIPGGSGNFNSVFGAPLSGSDVAFGGAGPAGQQGVYFFNGSVLSRVADLNTPIPGGTGNFTALILAGLSGSNVAFEGTGPAGQQGVYSFNGSVLSRVADLNTPIPNGTGNFKRLSGPTLLSGNNIAFGGSDNPVPLPPGGQQGIYLFHGGVLDHVADLNTLVPGGSGNKFAGFGAPGQPFTGGALSGGNVVFLGFGSLQAGLYLSEDGILSRVVDLGTPIPGGNGTFAQFMNEDISGGNVVFFGLGPGPQRGIYLFERGELSRVADTNTPIPAGTGSFSDFSSPKGSGRNVVFRGDGPGGQLGIYLFHDGVLDRVADQNTPIPGDRGNFLFF